MRRQTGSSNRPSLLTRGVQNVLSFVRLAEFELLFVLFFVILFLVFKDLVWFFYHCKWTNAFLLVNALGCLS
ncbi:hypothetical protein KP509_12G074700 [Ceratopteris richardii]|uniref:Transmembrane protein n=1 Tax=Ceratopteris richardii TaxID=49495 RepID=A0A8T2TKD1_CERRI|nr:hypothetical protein KP509_12G074700 [Ceratopteris richardii]